MANVNLPNNGNWGTTSTSNTLTTTSPPSGATGAQPAASPTTLQLAQAGAQTGIDLYLAQGSGVDMSAWEAETRGDMTASGSFTAEQINAYVKTARDAFGAAAAAASGGTAGASGATGSIGSTGSLQSYNQLTATVAAQVLPSGAEPQPLYTDPNAADPSIYAQGGSSLGTTLPAGSDLAQIGAQNTQRLLAGGASLHDAALYNQSMEQSYQQTQGASAASAGATGATAGATGSSAPPDPGIGGDFAVWYNGAAGAAGPAGASGASGTAGASGSSSSAPPSFADWSTFVGHVTDLQKTDPAQAAALVAQVNAAHPDWAANTGAILDVTTGDSAAQRAAKSYKPYVDLEPGIKTGDSQAVAAVQAFSTASFGNITKAQFSSVGAEMLSLKSRNDGSYDKAMAAVADPALKTALANAVNGFSATSEGKKYDPSNAKSAKNAQNFLQQDFTTVNDGKGNWINGGSGSKKNPSFSPFTGIIH